jgi:hypothetical protein
MSMTGAFLTRAIASFRRYTDEPTVNAKYTDAVLIQMLEESYAHILNEINRCSIEPIVARFNVTYSLSTSTTSHTLPAMIGAIFAIYYETDSEYKIFYDSRGPYNTQGRGVYVTGNTLHIQSGALSDGRVITVEYIPSGTARLHDGTCTVDSTGLLVTFGATPTDGTLDTHANAYAGSIFRIVSDTDADYNYTQERTITAYTNTTRVATLDVALSPNAGDGVQSGTTSYEIAPVIHLGLDHVIALYLAWWIASIEGSLTRARMLQTMWREALRNLRLNAYYSNLVDCRKMRADNYDNKRFSGIQRKGNYYG